MSGAGCVALVTLEQGTCDEGGVAVTGVPLRDVVVDLGHAEVRAHGPAGVVRAPSAAAWAGGGIVFGVHTGAAEPGAVDPRLPDAIDEEFAALGGRLFRVVDLLRGLLRHAIGSVAHDAATAAGPVRRTDADVATGPDSVTVAVPEAWGGLRRGVVERAADGLARRVRVVGSARAAVAAVRAERRMCTSAPIVVIEQWPDAAVACVVYPCCGAEPMCGDIRCCGSGGLMAGAAYRPGVLVGCGMDADGEALEEIAAAAGSGTRGFPARRASVPGAELIVPRGGWEFPRGLQASADGRRSFLDGDVVLRGIRRIG